MEVEKQFGLGNKKKLQKLRPGYFIKVIFEEIDLSPFAIMLKT